MILINIIILYFIQITHTDDFPSTGPHLVQVNLWFSVATLVLDNVSLV